MRDVIAQTKSFVSAFAKDEAGTQLVETAIWIGLITALVIVSVQIIGSEAQTALNTVATTMQTSM